MGRFGTRRRIKCRPGRNAPEAGCRERERRKEYFFIRAMASLTAKRFKGGTESAVLPGGSLGTEGHRTGTRFGCACKRHPPPFGFGQSGNGKKPPEDEMPSEAEHAKSRNAPASLPLRSDGRANVFIAPARYRFLGRVCRNRVRRHKF